MKKLIFILVSILVSTTFAGSGTTELVRAGENGAQLKVIGEKAEMLYQFLNVEEREGVHTPNDRLIKSTEAITCINWITTGEFECGVTFNQRGKSCKIIESGLRKTCE